MKIGTFFPSVLACGMMTIVLLCSSLPLFATVPGDEHWAAQFGGPGVTNTIYAVAMNNGMVYAAGATPSGTRTNMVLVTGGEAYQ